MKTINKIWIALALGGTLFMSSCAGGYYVSARLDEPVYERPVAPYDGAVWVGSDWVWSGGAYVHQNGHWERPRVGHAYIAGSWEQGSRGYTWRRGYWK